MERISVRELNRRATEQQEPYELHVQVEAILNKTAKSGKPFYELRLTDGEDGITLRAWEDSAVYPAVGSLEPGTFVAVKGRWWRNEPFGIDAKDWSIAALDEQEIAAMLEGTPELRERQSADFQEIEQFIASLEDPRLRNLGQLFLKRFGDRFRRTGAARNYHHARRGGLVEHVAQMMRSADAICGVYPTLNRDLLISGVLFHDCGKLWENVYGEADFTMPFTEVGELIGHIPLGMEIVNHLWRELAQTPEAAAWKEATPSNDQVRLHLLHLIGSHHGEMQFGSPVLPKTPEAIALHHVDNIDAKLEMFSRGYETAPSIGRNIQQRVRPLPGNLVTPLPSYEASGSD